MPPRKARQAIVYGDASFSLPGRTQDRSAVTATAHEIFKQFIEIYTTDSVGNVIIAAEAMADRPGFLRRSRIQLQIHPRTDVHPLTHNSSGPIRPDANAAGDKNKPAR